VLLIVDTVQDLVNIILGYGCCDTIKIMSYCLLKTTQKPSLERFSCTDVFLVQVPKTALKTPFRQGTVQDLAKKMLQLSKNGLSRRGNHEEPFLEPLQEIAEVGFLA